MDKNSAELEHIDLGDARLDIRAKLILNSLFSGFVSVIDIGA